MIAARNENDVETFLEKDEFLCKYKERFTIIEVPKICNEISSTKIRNMFSCGKSEAAKQFLYPGTYQMFSEFAVHAFQVINDFHTEEYVFLSNFYSVPVTFDGITYGNSEAAFQAQKALNDDIKLQFVKANAAYAKMLGRMVEIRPDWEFVKTYIMPQVVRAKFEQNPELAKKLLATGTAKLVEGNRWHDTFWGVDLKTGKGENYLGKILMCIRQEMRAEGE